MRCEIISRLLTFVHLHEFVFSQLFFTKYVTIKYLLAFAALVRADASLATTAPPLSDEEIMNLVTGEGVSDDDEDAIEEAVEEAVEEAFPVPPTAKELMDAVNVLNRMSLFCASGDQLRKEICSIESSVAKGKHALKKQSTLDTMWGSPK